jgi:hypothetical protein
VAFYPNALFAIALCLSMCAPVNAITTRFIDTTIVDTIDYTAVVAAIAECFEDKAPFFPMVHIKSATIDTAIAILQQSMAAIKRRGNGSLKGELLTSLTLLYLGQIGVPGSLAEAQRILGRARKAFPGSGEIPWLEGLVKICNRDVINGLRSLDSLRLVGFTQPEFLGDYARYVLQACVPDRIEFPAIFLPSPSPLSAVPLPADEQERPSYCWRVVSAAPDRNNRVPVYEYGVSFHLRKPFRLLETALIPRMQFHLSAPLFMAENIPMMLSEPLMRQLRERTDSITLNLYIDYTPTKLSREEYLAKRISGVYNAVENRDELRKYNALSVRCRKQSAVYGQEGTYAAFIVFDRRLGDIHRNRPGKQPVNERDGSRPVRFTIAMQSGAYVQELAEERLQAVLRAF